MGVLWANYKAGGFTIIKQDISQSEFAEAIIGLLSHYQSAFIVEDRSPAFRAGRGPVGMIVISTDIQGEVIKPAPIIFEWASTRNTLRGTASFFQFVKYSGDVTVCVVYGSQKENNMLQRQRRYGHNLWHIGQGIWCITGRKKNPRRQS